MASCITEQWSNSTTPQVRLTVTESKIDGANSKLSWTLEYVAHGYAANTSVSKNYGVIIDGTTVKSGTYDISGKTGTSTIANGTVIRAKNATSRSVTFSVSFSFNMSWSGVMGYTKTASGSITIPAKDTYRIVYNPNGGSGAPSSQTKTYGVSLTLTTEKPTRTGYSFQGWAESTSGSVKYASGATYTANDSITLYAVWKANTYSITYNANGGSGAPSSQTKTYGVSLTLSTVQPTRSDYIFKGWSITSSGAVSYSSGATYTANSSVTLYAVWELAYFKPKISNVVCYRCDSNGDVKDDGTYAIVKFDWETCHAIDKHATEFGIIWYDNQDNNVGSTGEQESDSILKWKGTRVFTIGGAEGTGGALDPEITYTIRLYVRDVYLNVSPDENKISGYVATVSSICYPIDFKAEGKGVAFGKAAELEGVADFGYKARFLGGLINVTLEPDTDLNSVILPNTYIGANISNYNYANCPVTSGTFTLIVESAGEEGQVRQTYVSCGKDKPEQFIRFYYLGEWGEWLCAGTGEVVLYENESGSTESITLSKSLSNYRYIEIYFTDNNGKSGGYTKVWKPNGKIVCLNISETSSDSKALYALYRQTNYMLSSANMTPDDTTAGYVQFNLTSKTISSASTGRNFIKIVRVIGRA